MQEKDFDHALGDARLGGVDERFKTRRVVNRSRHAWVLEAQHTVTGRALALKVAFPNETARARIRAEATALGAIAHLDGVVSVLDARVDGETATYLALEWLRGRSLEGILAARGSMPPAAVLGLGSVIADTLVEVHATEHVHGDLSPKHVFLSAGRRGKETVKLIDFGTSRLVGDATRPANPWTAPEVVGSKPRTFSSDVYSLGAILARMLVGQPLQSRDELPKTPFGGLLARALDPTPSARPTAADMLTELVRLRTEPEAPPPAPAPAPKPPQAPPPKAEVRRAPPARPPPTRAQVQPHAPITLQPAPGGELRKKTRAGYVTPVRVTRGDVVIDGRTEDVSESGLLLVLRDACTAGEQVSLRFALPMDGVVQTCTARVAWSRSHTGVPGMHAVGVHLMAAPRAVTEAIASYVKLMGVDR